MANRTVRRLIKYRTNAFLQQQKLVLKNKLKECLRNQRLTVAELSIDEAALKDPADLASALLGQEMSCLTNGLDSNRIDNIRLALSKIEEQTYGICNGCGQAIKRKRLAAISWATKCLTCQEADSG